MNLVSATVQTSDTPNILMILSDDHGIMDTGCYGNSVIHTPHIDRLAAEGLQCQRAFTPAAMCAPSRSSLFTGLNPHSHGCYMNHGSIRNDIRTLPHYLQEVGYNVGLAGKTHIKPREAFPFEYRDLNIDTIRSFMRSSQNEPFCLTVATNDPHAEKIGSRRGFRPSDLYNPQEVPLPPYLVDTPETREQRAGYYDLVTRMDTFLGKILDTLEELALTENTIVIYASDHGASFPFEKWTCYEAGLKVPMIFRWPGKIDAGKSTDAMVSFIDILPTFVDFAGGNPGEKNFDGQSIRQLLLGKSQEHHHHIYGTHTTEGIVNGSYYPVRSVRDDRYKYIQNINSPGKFTNIITASENQAGWGSWTEKAQNDPFAAQRVRLYQKRPREELYDLKHDPFEMTNRASDVAYADIAQQLKLKLRDWMESENDPELKNME